MKADVKKLERLLRKLAKGEDISEQELMSHWDDVAVIHVLNRTDSWETFARWTENKPAVSARFARLKDAASRASAIRDAVEIGQRNTWPDLRLQMIQDPLLFTTVVEAVETSATPSAVSFLTAILEEPLDHLQDQTVRKAIYRLKQRGVMAEESISSQPASAREIFVFGENRLARWQPIFYFRAHSMFTEAGDLFVFQLEEGRHFGPAEQRRDVQMDTKSLLELAGRYSESLEKQSGMKIGFHQTDPAIARFFLQKSADLLQGTAGERAISDFLKFIGEGKTEDPLLEFETKEGYMPDIQQASTVLESPYFSHWVFITEEVSGFISELEKMEQGPIVLPPAKLLEMRHAAANHWTEDYFSSKNRAVWSLAFAKAAYFLRTSDFYQAQSAWKISVALQDPETPIDRISAVAFLLERSVKLLLQEKKKQEDQEKQTSLIMSPAEFAAQNKPQRR